MKIGILSDTHDHYKNTLAAIAVLREREISKVIHCGDITTPEMVDMFKGFDLVFVFGNNDDDYVGLFSASQKIGVQRPGHIHSLVIDGWKVGVTHGDERSHLRRLVVDDPHTYVFRGHSHLRTDEQIGKARLINPGALGGKKPQSRSLAVLDLTDGDLEFIEI